MKRCPRCGDGFERCSKCSGRGEYNYNRGRLVDGWQQDWRRCDLCHGSGRMKCLRCRGERWVRE
jgi:DnaJ-class molecular chaperone